MTYNGQYVVNTNQNSLVAAPDQISYINQVTFPGTNLLSATSANTRHYSYVAGNHVYLLQGSTSGTRGFTVFRAPLTDPTNFVKTGNQLLTTEVSAHINTTLLTVGNYIYMYGINGTTAIYRASITQPEIWSKMTDVLPFAITGSNAVVIGSTIYIFGDGTTGANSAKILTASTSTPTVFTNSGSTLPAANSKMCLAITPTTLFLYGGFSGGIENGDVYSAPVSSPLVWTNVGPNTGMGNSQAHACYVSSSFIYIIGGNAGGSPVANIWRSPIADGVNFTSLYTFGTKSNITLQAINGRLYTYGGQVGASSSSMTETDIAALDANISNPWSLSIFQLPNTGVWGYMGIAIDNYYYMYSGMDTTSTRSNKINRVALHTPTATSRGVTNYDTTITGSTFPASILGGYVVRIDDTIWMFGGTTAIGIFNNKVWSAPVSNPLSITQQSLSGGPSSAHGQVCIINGYIYVIGGDNDNATVGNGISKTPITNPTQWVTSPSTIPVTKTKFNLAVVGGYVYLFGGTATISGGVGGASTTDVYRIPVSELDQTDSTGWVSITALATATQDSVMVISNGLLYLIGGCSTGFTSIGTVQCCTISELSAGISNFKSLGSFSFGVATIAGANAVYSNGDFYILSGRNGATVAAATILYRTENRLLMKAINDVPESSEAVLAISLGNGNLNSYNTFMQSGNFPWLVAKTT